MMNDNTLSQVHGTQPGDTMFHNDKTYYWYTNQHDGVMWVCHKPDKLNVKETQVEANAAEEDKDNGKDIDKEQEAMTILADDRNDE